jgi:hypothetical protein
MAKPSQGHAQGENVYCVGLRVSKLVIKLPETLATRTANERAQDNNREICQVYKSTDILQNKYIHLKRVT